MFHFYGAITNKKGDALPGYYVQLADSSSNVAPIYSDNNATPIVNSSGIANMALVDPNGMASFYVNPASYTLNIYGSDATTLYDNFLDVPCGLNTITLASGASVSTRSALAAISLPVNGQTALVSEPGREGLFVFDSANLSVQVTADPNQFNYVAPSSDTTGASGAWVRKQDSQLLSTSGAGLIGSDDGSSGALWSNVAGYISYLKSTAGSSIVGFTRTETGASVRTAQARFRDTVFLTDFGVKGDGVTDDTAAVQNAANAAAAAGKMLFVPAPAVAYRLTSQIAIPSALRIKGEGVTLTNGGSGALSTPSVGSWFFLNHTGIGFYLKDDANPNNAKWFSEIEGIGTYRTQPAPGAGWTPTVSGADFYIAHRASLDVFTFNPYIGVQVVSPGVLEIKRLRGQPLYTGIQVDSATDICDWQNIHFWPFWSQDSNVVGYTIVNAAGSRITRADGLKVKKFFTWGYARSILAKDAAGAGAGLSAFSLTDVYSDACGASIEIEADNYAAYGTINNPVINSDSAVRGTGAGIWIHGSVASKIMILGLNVTRASEEAVRVDGAAHIVKVQPLKIENWDRRSLGQYAFKADNGATINLLSVPSFVGSALLYLENSSTSQITLPANYRAANILGVYARRVSIADQTAVAIPLPPTTLVAVAQFVPDNPPGVGVPVGRYWVRGTASPSAVKVDEPSGDTSVALMTGVLTGTTGTAGNFTISPANDGNLYLENRTGAGRSTTVIVYGA